MKGIERMMAPMFWRAVFLFREQTQGSIMEKLPFKILPVVKNRCYYLPDVLSGSTSRHVSVISKEAWAPPPDPVLKNYFFNNQFRAYFSD